ncbi:MAG TPA: FkbM family methyltransferase [Candidatus Gastranaerophilales bacterium]|nr:FkbM family methyltransferase [Candidatus Gastranaerophilales bacterium]
MFKHSLENRINNAKLYRQVVSEELIKNKEICIICELEDIESAGKFIKENFNRDADYYSISNVDKLSANLDLIRKSFDIKIIFLEELAIRKDLAIVAYKNYRRYGIRLALNGIFYLTFDEEPKYSNYRCSSDFFDNYKDELNRVYNLLEDEDSKETLASVIKHRTTFNCGYLKIADYPEYMHPAVKADFNDVVVDGGGFDGKTSIQFAEQVGSSGKVYCFEPGSQNYDKIISRLKNPDAPFENIVKPVKFGLWNKQEKLNFSSNLGGSSALIFEENPNIDMEIISLTDLDSFVEENNITKIGLISLDIEGAEIEALEGAKNTIQKFKPKLQISIYHKADDLFKIPLWIDALNLNYKFYLGHHNTYSTETDLYAIIQN